MMINIPKLVNMCGYKLSTTFAKFHGNILSLSEKKQKGFKEGWGTF